MLISKKLHRASRLSFTAASGNPTITIFGIVCTISPEGAFGQRHSGKIPRQNLGDDLRIRSGASGFPYRGYGAEQPESAARTAQMITSLEKAEAKSLSFWREEPDAQKEKAQCLCEIGWPGAALGSKKS
jgi:hypothetical protein